VLACSQIAIGQARMWVFFADKGFSSPQEVQRAIDREESRLLSATRQRLLKVRPAGQLLTQADLPVCSAYLQAIEQLTGLMPHALCRAANAASYAFSPQQIKRVRELPFVRETRPVLSFRGEADPPVELQMGKSSYRSLDDSLFYGGSYLQNVLENFPLAHDAGYSGEGVFVGMLDAGWNNLDHICFDSLEIIATWDFVNGDSSVANDSSQMGEGSHGTKTLSCLAGYDPGNLIGAAYGISVALAKTENTESETLIEEDNWAAGIEWLDSLGCVIASSSVSYGTLHTYPELNGDSTIITIAADNAVARGMVVVNSAGNHGTWGYPGDKMSPPSDGDSVLAIGAANPDSSRASFSSMGPTYDGRIKPDLMALGVSVKVARPDSVAGYTYNSGTSFSTPITAGACALLLQADPALAPMAVYAFLKATGDQLANPDTLRGWGIYNVWQAIQDVLAGAPPQQQISLPDKFQIIGIYPNPFNPDVRLVFELPAAGDVCLGIYDVLGRQLAGIVQDHLSPGRHALIWEAESSSSAVYFLRLETPWGIQIGRAVMTK